MRQLVCSPSVSVFPFCCFFLIFSLTSYIVIVCRLQSPLQTVPLHLQDQAERQKKNMLDYGNDANLHP